MSAPFVFVTGGTGYIGRHLLSALVARGEEVRCVSRQELVHAGGVRFVHADLDSPSAYQESLRGARTVFHLAAHTGKGRPAEFTRTNVDVTKAFVAACQAARVQRLIFVSSIAATYPPAARYHYAASKAQAEAVVAASGIPYVIVRPTIVFGPGSPTWRSLAALARLPVPILVGDGRSRVQPIDVQDVVSALIAIADDRSLNGCAVELGGKDTVSIGELLRRMRRELGRRRQLPTIRIPVGVVTTTLSLLERVVYPLLPFTAGQFSVFAHDSDAHQDRWTAGRAASMIGIDEMIARSAGHAV